jgi:hypothetical protein
MPITTPLADIAEVGRSLVVTAYQPAGADNPVYPLRHRLQRWRLLPGPDFFLLAPDYFIANQEMLTEANNGF